MRTGSDSSSNST